MPSASCSQCSLYVVLRAHPYLNRYPYCLFLYASPAVKITQPFIVGQSTIHQREDAPFSSVRAMHYSVHGPTEEGVQAFSRETRDSARVGGLSLIHI